MLGKIKKIKIDIIINKNGKINLVNMFQCRC